MNNVRSRPPEALRARLLLEAARQPATRPGTWRRRAIVCALLAVLWMSLMIALLGFRHDLDRAPMGGLAQTLLVLIGIATVASVVGLARGQAMVGSTSEALLAVVACLPIALLVLVSAIDPRGPATLFFAGPQATVVHAIRCDLLVTAVALPLVGLGWALSRGLILARPALSGACLGLAAATWAHAVVRAHCAVGGPAHAIIAHLLPAIPLMVLSARVFSARDHVVPGGNYSRYEP